MHTALRPYMTTGVALVGASVIAVTPISPPPAEIHMPAPRVSSASVELTAAFDPITAYTQLFTNTFNNLVGLGGEVLADPAPILRQVLTNSIGNAKIIAGSLQSAGAAVMTVVQGLPAVLETARDQLSAGDFAGAVNTVFSYVLAGLLLQHRPASDRRTGNSRSEHGGQPRQRRPRTAPSRCSWSPSPPSTRSMRPYRRSVRSAKTSSPRRAAAISWAS